MNDTSGNSRALQPSNAGRMRSWPLKQRPFPQCKIVTNNLQMMQKNGGPLSLVVPPHAACNPEF